jgi:regulatory protein
VAPDREQPLELAGRALARRDKSVAELDAELARRGVGADDREAAVERLTELGYVDDARFARSRAQTLAERGHGDVAIAFDLGQRGIEAGTIADALGELDPEAERAGRLVAAATEPVTRVARRLAAKGFSADAIESVVGLPD